jgi:hypothetical protein
MKHSLPLLETEIRSLLHRPAEGGSAARHHVERTLTDGYAHALQLDGERLRAERRLRELVRAGGSAATGDGAVAARQLAEADRELTRLRALLSTLRAHAL